jgi:hypothetical protein
MGSMLFSENAPAISPNQKSRPLREAAAVKHLPIGRLSSLPVIRF